jgi:hypothetical protein
MLLGLSGALGTCAGQAYGATAFARLGEEFQQALATAFLCCCGVLGAISLDQAPAVGNRTGEHLHARLPVRLDFGPVGSFTPCCMPHADSRWLELPGLGHTDVQPCSKRPFCSKGR